MPVQTYGNRVRVRVNGLLVEDGKVLLAHIHSPITDELVWIPPGGGLEFGETLEACLKREFLEETGLEVEVHKLRFINELLEPPFHAVEFYFEVSRLGGTLKPGSDPEQHATKQLLKDVQWIDMDNFNTVNLAPPELKQVLSGNSDVLEQTLLYSSFSKQV